MTDRENHGLTALRELTYFAQALRRESSEWRAMSMNERRDEILSLVVEAADGRYVQDPEAQARAIAELVIKAPDQWPYWDYKSKEKSQDGWVAWHVVHTMVRRLSKEDPEQLTKPPLSEWMARHLENPQPARAAHRPDGARSVLHRVAVRGVSALLDAGLCELTGKTTGEGWSCCDLVARELGVGWRAVYNAWRAHEKRLAACVDTMIVMNLAGQDSEACPIDAALKAVLHTARVYGYGGATSRVIEAWRKDGELAEHYAHVRFVTVRRTDKGLLKKTH